MTKRRQLLKGGIAALLGALGLRASAVTRAEVAEAVDLIPVTGIVTGGSRRWNGDRWGDAPWLQTTEGPVPWDETTEVYVKRSTLPVLPQNVRSTEEP